MDRDLLERIDGHMERGNELMETVREEIRLSREEIRLSREEVRLSREQHADLRIFIRDITRRAERVTQEMIAELRKLSAGYEDAREETRAQTQALLRMIDRLGPSQSSA